MTEMTDLIARLTRREALHDGHPDMGAHCTEEVSLADFRAILSALRVAQEYAEFRRAELIGPITPLRWKEGGEARDRFLAHFGGTP